MKDDTSTPTPEDTSPNQFERGKSGTAARDRAEAAIENLRLSGGVFVEAVRATRMAMVVTDPSLPGDPIVFANQSFLKMSGYRMEEVLGQQPHFLNGRDTDPKDATRFVEALRHDQDDLVETVQYRKDGSRFVATVLLSAFKDDEGKTIHHFLSWLDVTRRVEAESEVAELRSEQSALRGSEARMRKDEEQQRYLLKLSDALRPLQGAQEVAEAASRILAETVGADRAYYVQWPAGADYGEVSRDYAAPGLASLAGRYPVDAFRSAYDHIAEGKTWIVEDASLDPALDPGERQYFLENGVVAWIDVPLLKDGVVHAALCLVQASPRSWTMTELAMAEETAERCWAAVERARAEAAMRASEQKHRSLFETMGQGYCEFELVRDAEGRAIDQRYLTLNPAFERIFGIPVVDAEGRLASEVFPSLERWWHEQFDQIAKSSKPARIEHKIETFDRWFEVTAYPHGPDHLTALYEDITVRKRAELALRESEQRFRALVTAGAQSIYRMSPDWGLMYQLDSDTLANTSEPIENWVDKYILSEDLPQVRAAIDRAIATKSLFELEHRVRIADGGIGWVMSRAVPLLDEEGSITEWFGAGNNVSDRKRAESALRERDERQAFLLRLSDALRPLLDATEIQNVASRLLAESLGVLRAGFGELEGKEIVVRADYSPRADSIVGRYPIDAFGPTLAKIYREGGTVVLRDAATDTAISDGERASYASLNVVAHVTVATCSAGQPVISLGVQSEAPRDWSDADVALIKDVAERTWAAVARARAEQALRESERHANILLAELQHRVRNTLGVVRSIARRTAENSHDVEGMLGHFQGRLDAFSRVQAALTRSAGATVDLASLIEDEMVAHAAKEGEQVSIAGPDLDLDPRTAERLSLAIHELTTNAVKHGAFVTSRGKVKIRWTTASGNGAADELALSWTESGVTIDPLAIRRDGFGMELLQRSLPYDLRGETSVEFRPHGLHFELRMPLHSRN